MPRRGFSVLSQALAVALFILISSLLRAPLAAAEEPDIHDTPVPLSIEWVTDCGTAGATPPACGTSAGTWPTSARPVIFCTRPDEDIPVGMTEADFAAFIRAGAEVWNRVEAAIGFILQGLRSLADQGVVLTDPVSPSGDDGSTD